MSDEGSDDGRNLALIIAVAVVGFVFLIGAVVIGAAVIGSFVLGVGEEQAPAQPTASFEFSEVDSGVEVMHAGGDAIPADEVTIRVDGESRGTWANMSEADSIKAGDAVRLSDAPADATVQVVWSSESETAVLAAWERDRTTTSAV